MATSKFQKGPDLKRFMVRTLLSDMTARTFVPKIKLFLYMLIHLVIGIGKNGNLFVD